MHPTAQVTLKLSPKRKYGRIARSCFSPGRHVSDILADEMTGGKVLVFAHHRNVLDALEQSVVRTGRVEYIRIDGRTKVGKYVL